MAGHRRERAEQWRVIDVCNGGAQPGEVEGLARGPERDQPTPETFIADRERSVDGARMDQLAPDLVADHQQIVALGDLGDRRHLLVVEDSPCRVVGIAEQDHPGRVVDRGGEPIGRYPPTVRIERDIDPPAPAVGDRVQEGVIDRREHHDTVAPVGRVPQRHLERVQRTGEGPDPFTVRTPPVCALLPGCVVLDEVGSERSVAEIPRSQ
jgi:hypothetical protein